jgi:hypothetical protein
LLDEIVQCMLAAELGLLSLVIDPVLLGGCHCPRLRPRRISANGRGLLECYRRRGLQKVVVPLQIEWGFSALRRLTNDYDKYDECVVGERE